MKLIVTSGIGQRGLFAQRLLGLISLLGPLALAVAGIRALGGDAEGARNALGAAPVLLIWTAAFGPFALWRNRVVLDREAGTLVHTWGFPGWSWGRRSCALPAFRIDERDAEPGAVVVRRPTGCRVQLTDGKESVTLRIFAYGLQAWRLSRRVADFLGHPPPGAAEPPRLFSYLLTRVLLHLSAVIGLIAGVALFFVVLGWVQPRLPARPWLRMGAILFLWAAAPLFCIAVSTSWARFVPVGCPRCGGRARLRWGSGFFGTFHYACRDCGSSWRPGTSNGIGGSR